MNNCPNSIGLFDSGIGGLSVLKAIKALLPKERLIYLADTAFCPYGPKSPQEVTARVRTIVRFLMQKGCRIIVFACNTATAAAIDTLRAEYPGFPFVGMEPAIKPAVHATRSGIVAVLATRGTLQGPLYNKTLSAFAQGVQVIEKVGEGWVEAVEQGALNTPATRQLVSRVVTPLLAAGADTFVLGCTHYPFLIPVLREVVGPAATIIDPAPAVARRVTALVQAEKPCEVVGEDPSGANVFYTTLAETKALPRAVENMANVGTINWIPYTLENIS